MRRLLKRDGGPYMVQWRVLRTRFLTIHVHEILSADTDPDLHTHPFRWVWSLKLRGSYTEQTPSGFRKPFRLDWVRSPHRIATISGPVTSVFVGVWRLPTWGFIRNGVFEPR